MKPCSTCPFVKGTKNFGALDWIRDVMIGVKLNKKNFTHTCHKTDPNADGYVGHKDGKDSVCAGFIAMKQGKNDFGCFEHVDELIAHHFEPHLKLLTSEIRSLWVERMAKYRDQK